MDEAVGMVGMVGRTYDTELSQFRTDLTSVSFHPESGGVLVVQSLLGRAKIFLGSLQCLDLVQE